MKSKYLIAVIVVLVILNFVLSYRNCLLKRQIKKEFNISKKNSLPIEFIPNFSLYDLKGIKCNLKEIVNGGLSAPKISITHSAKLFVI